MNFLGTQACINAASTVSGIIGDLETTIMFATAGNLNPDNENESFADHRENILKTAKALVEDTKTLVAGAASSQEQLAVAAQNSVATIGKQEPIESISVCGNLYAIKTKNEFGKFNNKKENNEKRRIWITEILHRRPEQRAYYNFIQEMHLQDREKLFNYMRMAKELFDILI